MPKYLLNAGMDYPPNRRAEAGDIVDDLPAKSIKWLREQGYIEAYDASAKAAVDVEPEVEVVVVEEPTPEPTLDAKETK